jgi:hypothetical protein
MLDWISAEFHAAISSLDLSLSDTIAFVFILGFPAVRLWRNRNKATPRSELLVADLLRGAAFSTFLIVLLMAGSKTFMMSAYDHNRVVLFLSGIIGAFTVVKADKWIVEFFKEGSA